MKSKINLKLDLSMLNTILMVVVLILVIVACVRKYRENFDTCYITPNENKTDGEWYEGDKGFKCEGSGRWADGGSFGADKSWDLDAMTSIKDWAQSDDGIHNYWVYGKARLDIQLQQSAMILFNILDRIVKVLKLEGDSGKTALKKVKTSAENYFNTVDDTIDYGRPNLENIIDFIKSSGYYSAPAETLIKKLDEKHATIKKLIDLTETKDGKIDNDARDKKKQHWNELLEGTSDTYKIMDVNNNQINFLKELNELIDEEALLFTFVDTIITDLDPTHKKIAFEIIGFVPTTQAFS
jgi:hypothetical protein